MADLYGKIAEMSYEKLIADTDPQPKVAHGTIKRLGTAATLKRGTLLSKNAAGLLIVAGSDVDDTGTFSATGDGSKTVFAVVPGGDPTSKLTEVKVDGAAVTAYTYHPLTGEIVFDSAPANTKSVAIKYSVGGGNANCILAEDTDVGTSAEVVAPVYVKGSFNSEALILATGYSLSDADKEDLRKLGIYLAAQPVA